MSVTVLTYATHETPAMRRAMESYRRIGGVEPVVVGMGETHSWQKKISLPYEWCLANPEANVLFVDAYDTCCVRSLARLESPHTTVLFSAETNCWPDKERAGEYPPYPSDYLYLNSGVWLATGLSYVRLVKNRRLLSGVTDDQRAYTDAYLSFEVPMSLDNLCILAHNRYRAEDDWEIRDGLYWVKSTGTAPLVVHGNGGSSIEKVWEAFGV